MDLAEASNLSPDEEFDHWWIVTRFCYVERVLALAAAQAETVSVIEFGCGTAQNLRFCREGSRFKKAITRVDGVDPALPGAVRHPWMESHDHVGPAPKPNARHDVLLAMDVLEHIYDDAAALGRWLTYLKPGGYVLVTVPALQWLWSYHDERLGHVRRHTRSTIDRLAHGCGLQRVRTRYAFGHVMPIAGVVRKLPRARAVVSTDLRRHSTLVNRCLKQVGRFEARLGGNRWGGTSVIGVFRKNSPADTDPDG